jgi:hypothetical protein
VDEVYNFKGSNNGSFLTTSLRETDFWDDSFDFNYLMYFFLNTDLNG